MAKRKTLESFNTMTYREDRKEDRPTIQSEYPYTREGARLRLLDAAAGSLSPADITDDYLTELRLRIRVWLEDLDQTIAERRWQRDPTPLTPKYPARA